MVEIRDGRSYSWDHSRFAWTVAWLGKSEWGYFALLGFLGITFLVSAVNWAVFSVLSRRGPKSHPASLMMFYVMTFGWIFTSIHFFTNTGFGEMSELTYKGWLGILFLGVFCSGLAYIAWYGALQALSAAETGVFLYIEPLVVVAFLILGENITPASVFGGAVILFGVWLVNRKQVKGR